MHQESAGDEGSKVSESKREKEELKGKEARTARHKLVNKASVSKNPEDLPCFHGELLHLKDFTQISNM